MEKEAKEDEEERLEKEEKLEKEEEKLKKEKATYLLFSHNIKLFSSLLLNGHSMAFFISFRAKARNYGFCNLCSTF